MFLSIHDNGASNSTKSEEPRIQISQKWPKDHSNKCVDTSSHELIKHMHRVIGQKLISFTQSVKRERERYLLSNPNPIPQLHPSKNEAALSTRKPSI
uniref:Uncharacterized protein n=1 Tax=Rhizophora mucronata TaxID=61149 RepID=A0A2P2P7Z1_RHIMU